MTLLGQSRKEDQKPTTSIVNPRNKTRIGNWNVRTMFKSRRARQVAREMKRYKLDISECRWKGSGKSKLNTGEVIIYSDERFCNADHLVISCFFSFSTLCKF